MKRGSYMPDWKMKETLPWSQFIDGEEADGKAVAAIYRAESVRADGPYPLFFHYPGYIVLDLFAFCANLGESPGDDDCAAYFVAGEVFYYVYDIAGGY